MCLSRTNELIFITCCICIDIYELLVGNITYYFSLIFSRVMTLHLRQSFVYAQYTVNYPVMILSFRTDRSSLIRVYTVCNSGCIFQMHYFLVKPSCSVFRMITPNFWGIRIFRGFTVMDGLLSNFVHASILIKSWYYERPLHIIFHYVFNRVMPLD